MMTIYSSTHDTHTAAYNYSSTASAVHTHGEPRSPPGGDGGSIGRSGEPPPDMSHLQPGGGGPAQRKATVVWHRGVWDSRLPPWLGNTQCASIVRMSTGLTADLRTERPGPVG